MGSKSLSFFSGFFVGALASMATALLFVLQPGGGTRPTTEGRPKSFSNKAKKALDRYLEELGSWSGEGTRTRDLAPEAYAEAPLGWY